jgi:alkanesulfonate monooxygenase SsuD/methylene tetrahydromethanopterin reductase-like flavin-dependent oxidoreductase (luciferase family)
VSVSAVEVGILLPTREAVMSGRFDTAPLLAMAERIEAAGYDSVWVGDSVLARPRFDPLTLLAAVAARTRRVRLGTAVLLPALRHPLVLAHMVATLDRIADGRVILGVGIAPDTPAVRKEFEAAGVPFAQRVGRLEESIVVCRALWSQSAGDAGATVNGRYWSVSGARVLPTPTHVSGPPIWMGGEVEAASRRAGRLAAGWLPNSVTPKAWTEGWTRVQREAAAAGRTEPLTPALYTTIAVGRDARAAERELHRFVENYYAAPYEVIARIQGLHAGDPASCRERLQSFVAAGVRHIVLRFGGADQDAQLELTTREILPALKK